MSDDDLTNRGPTDRDRINMNEDWEVRYWCSRYGATHEELVACVAEVGPRTADVEQRLRAMGKKIFSNTGED